MSMLYVHPFISSAHTYPILACTSTCACSVYPSNQRITEAPVDQGLAMRFEHIRARERLGARVTERKRESPAITPLPLQHPHSLGYQSEIDRFEPCIAGCRPSISISKYVLEVSGILFTDVCLCRCPLLLTPSQYPIPTAQSLSSLYLSVSRWKLFLSNPARPTLGPSLYLLTPSV